MIEACSSAISANSIQDHVLGPKLSYFIPEPDVITMGLRKTKASSKSLFVTAMFNVVWNAKSLVS